MIFGNKNDFAIEIIFSDRSAGEWMFGNLYMYIGGRRIGRYDEETTLSDAMRSFEGIYSARDRRIYEDLFYLDKDVIFEIFYMSMYGIPSEDISRMIERLFSESSEPYRMVGDFFICPEVDVLDPWDGYLVSSGEFDKIIYGYTSKIVSCGEDLLDDYPVLKKGFSDKIRSIILKRGIFDSVVKESLDYLHEQYAILNR